MKYLQENKKRLIITLFSIATLLLAIRLIFFLQDGTSDLVESILIYLIVLLSIGISLLIIFPVKMSLKEYWNKYRDIFILSIYIFYTEVLFIIDNKLEFSSITIFAIFFMLSIVGIICLLLPKKVKFGFMIFICSYLTIYLVSQDVYYDIFSDFFSYKEIVALGAGLEFAGGVLHFRVVHALITLAGATAIILLSLYKTDNQVKLTKNMRKLLYIPLLFFVLVNLNAEYPVKSARLYLSDHYLYYSKYTNTKFIARFGSINYSVRDFFDSVIPKRVNKKDIKDIDEFFENNPKVHIDNEYSGIFKDKNLIFIAAESFDDIALNEVLTPNLLRLKNEGLYFSNNFVPVYPRTTCDSEFIFNTGLIPSITDGPTCYMFNENSYPDHSLASLFIEKGYKADAFHSNEKEFYTRYKVYKGLGFENFYGQHEIGLTNHDKRYDSRFFEKAQDLIIKEDGKFFSFITTLSGHSPYNSDHLAGKEHYEEVERVLGEDIPEEVKYYIATQREVDLFVGKIFEDLTEKGLLDDTVIVFTGDHYPYTMETNTYEEYTHVYDEYLKNKTPLFIWANNIEHKEIQKLSSSFDILPTIGNLFALDIDYTYYFGNDVFNDDYEPIVIYKDYSWYDGENYVADAKKRTGTGDDEYIQKRSDKVYEYFDISIKILRTDYFKYKK